MNCSVQLTPVVAHLRVYDDGGSYEQRSAYTCIMTVLYLTDETVLIMGAHGRLSKLIVEKIEDVLRAVGVKKMTYERDGVDVEVDL